MTLLELLRSETLCLPLKRKEDEDLGAFLNDKIEVYLLKIKSIPSIDLMGKDQKENILKKVRDIKARLLLVFKNYYDSRLSDALCNIHYIFDNILNDTLGQGFFTYKLKMGDFLFRMREKGDSEDPFDRQSMFHIKFTERENVKNYRYSMAGCPSLYFGSNPNICYHEIGKPEKEKVYCSKFGVTVLSYHDNDGISTIVDSELTLLDLRNWLPLFQQHLPKNPADENALLKYLILWPLIAACSVKVNHPEKYFKPEYLIPQLVYQHIRPVKYDELMYVRHKIDGIIYSSTKLDEFDPQYDYNVAIPVSNSGDKLIYDSLAKCFSWSNPVYLGGRPENFWGNIDYGEME